MLEEEVLTSGPAAVEAVTGERPHYSTYFRWTEYGVRSPDGSRVRLEYLKCGKKRRTSREAVHRFFRALTCSDLVAGYDSSAPRQRRSAISHAERELDDAGI